MVKDRKDGKYITPTDSIHAIIPYLMESRTESEVYMRQVIDITELKKWIDKQNKKLTYKVTYFHALASIISKTIYNRPLLNRFVQGHRIYQRNNVSISFVAKDKFTDNAEEKIIVLKVKEDDTALTLSSKMVNDIFKTRTEGTNDLDSILKLITKMPRWLLRGFTHFVKWLDYHGWLPEFFTSTDSNYSTVLLSNLGSIKCGSCYHHLNNYGTNSIVITIGTVWEENDRVFVDLSCTLDERIADGFYFAKSIKLMQYIASNPKLLEKNMSEEVDYE